MTKEFLKYNELNSIIFLKKKSDYSFYETILSQFILIFSALYFLFRGSYNYFILTESKVILVVKNKTTLEHIIKPGDILSYNGASQNIEITNNQTTVKLKISILKITFDEAKSIHLKLSEFNSKN